MRERLPIRALGQGESRYPWGKTGYSGAGHLRLRIWTEDESTGEETVVYDSGEGGTAFSGEVMIRAR